jgi:hypothetical protein
MDLLLITWMTFSLVSAITPGGSNRELLIFGDKNNQLVIEQLRLVADAHSQLTERDIIIVKADKEPSLYHKYQVAEGAFAIILVGKDGGEKFRGKEVLPMEELFALVDSMPMRKAEIRKKASRKSAG